MWSYTIIDNGEEVKKFTNKHGGRGQAYAMHAEAGKPYDIEIRFQYFSGDAQLNFDLGFKEEVNIKNTVAKVKDADIVIFAGGISPSLEGEEMGVNLPGFRKGDRTDIELPAVQRELIKALCDAGKKLFSLIFPDHPLLWSPKPNIVRPFYKHGIRDNPEVKLPPKSCLEITILQDAARYFLPEYSAIA